MIATNARTGLIEAALTISMVLPLFLGWLLLRRSKDRDGPRGLSEVDPSRWIEHADGNVAEVDMLVRSVTSSGGAHNGG